MSTTRTVEPYPSPACDLNVWPEYPEIRYWSDLAYTPARRPFYAFCHPDVADAAARHRRRRELRAAPRPQRSLEELEAERRWQEEQQYWWDVAAGKQLPEPSSESAGDDGGEGESAHRSMAMPLKLAITAMTRPLTSATTLVGSVREVAPRVSEIVLGILGLTIQLCYLAGWALFAGCALFGVVHAFITKYMGNLIWEAEPTDIWYENVPRFRAWNVAVQRGA